MDTKYDFFTPEFLHLLFFKQKNLLIYPYVDIEHLKPLQNFLLGYKVIEIESSDLFNIKDVVTLEIEENESAQESYFIISNLPRKDIHPLSKVKGLHCIINSSANLTDFKTDAFVIYNKKRGKFMNYPMEEQDLSFEKKIFLEKDENGSISTILDKIHESAKKIVNEVNANGDRKKITEILSNYSKQEAERILGYTAKFFSIERAVLRINPSERAEDPNPSNGKEIAEHPVLEEYEKIVSFNKRLSAEFVPALHEYRLKRVNESNLDLKELYSPESLYTYLRKHHWKEGIPEDFLKEWLKMENSRYQLTEQDILDFEILLNELNVPTKILMSIIKPIRSKAPSKILSKNETSQENPRKSKRTEKKKVQRKKKAFSEPIPPVKEFETFKSWILRKLDQLEKSLGIIPT